METPKAEMSRADSLSFKDFQALLADLLNLNAARITPEAYFITDLGVDSIRMVEVLLRLEEMGLDVSPDLAWEIPTVGDAYRYYQQQTSGRDL